MMRIIIPLILILCITAGCAAPQTSGTLADIDITNGTHIKNSGGINHKNEDQIRAAYAEYLRHAAKSDISRRDALQRLAQLEFNLTEKLDKTKQQKEKTEDIEDKLYYATLDRSIALLQTSLRDYPNAKNNDKILYQLAKAYDQRGRYNDSIQILTELTKKYPKSAYYAESEFRLGENAFSRGKYANAEDTYTNVIVAPKNSEYLENALYKRGWARYKQGYYQDAIDDFLHVIKLHHFSDFSHQDTSEKSQFNEYFRAVALSFSYLGGARSLDSYFRKHKDFPFIYHAYAQVSDVYLSQQRYTDAANTLESYINNHPESSNIPLASIKVLDIWAAGGFDNKLINSLSEYYKLYRPQSNYWIKHKIAGNTYNKITNSLRKYLILAASHYHKRYMQFHDAKNFDQASLWYRNYIKSFSEHSRQDKIYTLYAELLSSHNDDEDALANYEKAAYDSGIILNKDAAYATILISSRLYKSTTNPESKATYLGKLISYTLRYTQLYPNDKSSIKIISNAAQSAFSSGLYQQAIKLTEQYSGDSYSANTYNLRVIKANAYFKLSQFPAAESAYRTVITHYKLNSKTKSALQENLALSIYNQGKQAQKSDNINTALHNYARIHTIVPQSRTAVVGLYEAIQLCMSQKNWRQAILYIKDFQVAYPDNPLQSDVSKKLSIAYLNSHQDLAAADELVKISRKENDNAYKRAALWKAGQLYESKNNLASAINSYTEYARQYRTPFPQYMEAMQKLVTLYKRIDSPSDADKWLNRILRSDKRTSSDLKTERTRFISSTAALDIAHTKQGLFDKVQLTVPLQKSLNRKKAYMEEAVNLYGQASRYGISEIATEATFEIGEIYLDFSKSLLNSERPHNLSKTELEQYNILLQDRSYPFEDKAIEFYATNLSHVKDGIYNSWMQKSYARLQKLYPERYSRTLKLEAYINVLQ